jgi:homoserine kinase
MAKPTFKASQIEVQVPATSANLGPGFDSFGLALGMHDRYIAMIVDEPGLDIEVMGEGAGEVPLTDKNLLVKAMYKGFEFLGGKPKGISIRALNVIPHRRGLGSSASAIVGGLSLARALVLTGSDKMSDEKLLQLATEMEGHPDNVAAALYGGAVVAWQEIQHGKSVAQAISLSVDTRIRAVAFTPANSVATSKARKMLPESIPHSDATKNSAHTALLVHALTLRPDLLYRATEDFLHQSYRSEAMPTSFALLSKLRAAGVAACISGAGPTVLALHTGNEFDVAELMRATDAKFEAKSLEISRTGAVIL